MPKPPIHHHLEAQTHPRSRWASCLAAWTTIAWLGIVAVTAQPAVEWWSSSEGGTDRLAAQTNIDFGSASRPIGAALRIDDSITFQSILGIGSSLEHSTCHNLGLLPPDRRDRVIESLVHPTRGIGMSLMRICIGTSDFAPGPFYTYNDLPPGETDAQLRQFSIENDRDTVLPVLKAALRHCNDLRFFASPWSPPAWMKTNGRIGGGELKSQHYPHFAEYLARFVEAYRTEGIEIQALTVQNEPEFAPEAYPTCRWSAAQQRDFIRDHLGPLFQRRNLPTRIWAYDHNFNHPGYPATMLSDPEAARFIDGTAFHLYEGQPSAMARLQRRFPDKHLYFTEGSTYGAVGAAEIIEYFRNGSRSYNAWVTLIDHQGQPNVSGFHDCDPTAIVLNSTTLELDYRFDFFMYGHFSKFVRPGALRIQSTSSRSLPRNVAFRNIDGSLVLIAANPDSRPRNFSVFWRQWTFSTTLNPKSLVTFRWPG